MIVVFLLSLPDWLEFDGLPFVSRFGWPKVVNFILRQSALPILDFDLSYALY